MMKTNLDNGARALIERVEQTAFFTHYSLLGDGNIRQYDWEKFSARLSGLEKGLWKFLLLGEAITKAEAAELLGEAAFKFLLRHELCKTANGKVSLGALRFVRFWGLPMFIERGVSSPSFIGDDIKALVAILPRMKEGRCLSLYTAGGLEVLPLVPGSNMEMAFAEVKTGKNILSANLELNQVDDNSARWQFSRNGKGSYDLIVSNPPCFFQPPGIKMPFYGAGGADGLKCVRKFLQAASTELKPGGLALTTFAFFADVDAHAMEERLRDLLASYKLNYVVAVSSKMLMEPGVPLFNQLIANAMSAPNPPKDVGTVMKKTINYIQRKKYGAAHLLKGRFWKGEDGAPLEQQITNYSDSYYGTWTI